MKVVQTIAAMSAMCAIGAATGQTSGDAPHSTVINRAGQAIGTAVFAETPSGVLISVVAERLPSGEHGFHIHAVGRCDPKTGFSSAGDHFAPERKRTVSRWRAVPMPGICQTSSWVKTVGCAPTS